MKVELVNQTPNALETLIFTKSTRLNLSGTSFEDIFLMSEEDKLAELEYMKGTIKSSWEFVDFIFVITGVTRAFTHQLVRHRVGTSFAQQAQRVVDLSEFEAIPGPSIEPGGLDDDIWNETLDSIRRGYSAMVAGNVRRQDARGVIPTAVSTNIIFKANLRTLHEMARVRLCVKVQGEFQDVFRAIRSAVVEANPWAEGMMEVECAWSGTCAFPSYPTKDCPVKPFVYDPLTSEAYGGGTPRPLIELRRIHESERAEAQPGV